jgi:large subunit ribosomal protein L19
MNISVVTKPEPRVWAFFLPKKCRHDKVIPTMANKVISPAVDAAKRAALDLRAGDSVRVWQKIKEKDKFRLQAFEGLVLARKHGTQAGATFTVRKVIDGVGVERIFPLYSPAIDKVELIRRSKVRRAKLYFIREKAAKEIRHQMRRIMDTKYEEEETVVTPVEVKVGEAKKEESKEAKK